MKVSYKWLESFFEKKLPLPEKLAELLTMHSFEVEQVSAVSYQLSAISRQLSAISGQSSAGRRKLKADDFILDIDVLPNRAHDCLSHLGIAREIGAILDLKINPPKARSAFRREKIKSKERKAKNSLEIEVSEPNLCRRYTAVAVENVKVKDSPKWLKERLLAIGQKPINNIVDATNYVMFELGQPLHAFDADKVEGKIIVRKAKTGERITTLDGQEVELGNDILVIADEKGSLAIAGIKGGKKAEITKETKNIILEAANFEPTNIRKGSRKIGIRTESSLRFEAEISPEFTAIAMERLLEIILKIAGGKGTRQGTLIDYYPRKRNGYFLGIRPREVSKLLGIEVGEKEIAAILKRLGFAVKKIDPIKNVLKTAKSLAGKPYKYGASVSYDAPQCFDCSSFVSYVFSRAGVQIPRTSIDQYVFGAPVEEKNLKPGDVIFSSSEKGKVHFKTTDFMKGAKVNEGVDHCGIYLGKGKVIHASRHNSDGITVEDYKKSRQFKNIRGFRRFVEEGDALFLVEVPFWRLDVRIREDLIEEIGRIYGYEKISPLLPKESIIPPARNDNFFYAEIIRDILTGFGFSEVYNYSFDKKGDIKILNPVSSDKAYLRKNLLRNLARAAEENLKHFRRVKIFELGKIFPLAGETASLAAIDTGADFYEMKGVLEELFERLGITDFYFEEHPQKAADVRIGNTSVGELDHNSFELNFEMLVKLAEEEAEYRPVSRYPAVKRDISLFVPMDTKVIEVMDVIENTAGPLLVDTDLFDIYEIPEEGRKSFAFHLVFQSPEKTLSDKEVNDLMDKIMDALDAETLWEVRRAKEV